MATSPLLPTTGITNESARDAWVRARLAEVPRDARILDAGAGEQRYREACLHLRYVAQDFARYDGVGNGAGLHTGRWDQSRLDIVSDITAIPEQDGSFDVVLCTEVLEHLPDPLAALAEFARLLRPSGRLIVTAPFCSLTHFARFFFYTGFSRYFYETHLPRLGFRIDRLETNGNYFEYLAQELRRLPSIAERYAGSGLRFHEKAAFFAAIWALRRLSQANRGSEELLHFGCHVTATREA